MPEVFRRRHDQRGRRVFVERTPRHQVPAPVPFQLQPFAADQRRQIDLRLDPLDFRLWDAGHVRNNGRWSPRRGTVRRARAASPRDAGSRRARLHPKCGNATQAIPSAAAPARNGAGRSGNAAAGAAAAPGSNSGQRSRSRCASASALAGSIGMKSVFIARRSIRRFSIVGAAAAIGIEQLLPHVARPLGRMLRQGDHSCAVVLPPAHHLQQFAPGVLMRLTHHRAAQPGQRFGHARGQGALFPIVPRIVAGRAVALRLQAQPRFIFIRDGPLSAAGPFCSSFILGSWVGTEAARRLWWPRSRTPVRFRYGRSTSTRQSSGRLARFLQKSVKPILRNFSARLDSAHSTLATVYLCNPICFLRAGFQHPPVCCVHASRGRPPTNRTLSAAAPSQGPRARRHFPKELPANSGPRSSGSPIGNGRRPAFAPRLRWRS